MEDSDYTQGLPLISPKNMLPVKVIRREVATQDVVTIALVLPGTTQSPAPYLPGQFVTLALPTPRETLYRSYSLCGDGNPEEPWEITVKRQHMGAVSTYFYNSVQEGTLLYASLPRGIFTLPASVYPEDRFIFVAVGSGITPIFGMLRYLARLPDDQRPLVQLHYASRTVDDIIYRDELELMDPYQQWIQPFYYLSSEGDRLTEDAVVMRAGRVAQEAHFYYCGPESLKKALIAALADEGVLPEQIHAEVFATQQAASERPAYRLAGLPNVSQGGSIKIAQTGQAIEVGPQETILVALERRGYRPDFSCRAGSCGACKLKLIAGDVDPVGEALTATERDDGYFLSCIARPLGSVTLATGGRPPAGVAIVDPAIGATVMGNPRKFRNVALVRVGSLAALGALMLGVWNMTDHRPLSWNQPAYAAPASNNTPTTGTDITPGSTSLPVAPTATLRPGQPTPLPTATLRPGQPTPTSAPPAPTATTGPVNTPVPTSTTRPGQPTSTPAPTPTATPIPPPTATPKPAPTATATPSK